MTKFSDLQDALSAGIARDNETHEKARRFCLGFASEFATFLGVANERVFFVKKELEVDTASRNIIPPEDPIEHVDGMMTATLVFRVDNTDVFVPFSLALDPLADALTVTLDQNRQQQFDVRQGIPPVCEHIHGLAIARFSSGLKIDSVVTL